MLGVIFVSCLNKGSASSAGSIYEKNFLTHFTKALQIENVDFEDVLQYVCAKENKCDVIVTSNKKHFLFSEVQICSPNEFLNRNK